MEPNTKEDVMETRNESSLVPPDIIAGSEEEDVSDKQPMDGMVHDPSIVVVSNPISSVRSIQKQDSTELRPLEKIKRIGKTVCRILALILALYLFICSLGLMENAFKLLGGRTAGKTFQQSQLLSNPITGLMIGILATVLVQSSSTSTSIVVSLVASEVIPLQSGIPIIMGANIGTTITNTFVALAQVGQRDTFSRAFAGATVHDIFNWLSVLVLLPLEIFSHYLYHLSGALVRSIPQFATKGQQLEFLTTITKPFTERIVETRSDAITELVLEKNMTSEGVLKRWCGRRDVVVNFTQVHFHPVSIRCSSELTEASFLQEVCSFAPQNAVFSISWNTSQLKNVTMYGQRCDNLFAQTDWSDTSVGAVLLVLALVIILISLFSIVKLLNSLLQGQIARVVSRYINNDLPGKAGCFSGYFALLVGCALTTVLQSSSIFTSALTPLVGMGIVSIERMYPLSLGSNIGTTVTGMLAALSTQGHYMKEALQIAFCHLLFNLSGLIIFYPLPFMRWPIPLAKVLGRKTAEYRWIAILYLVVMFLVLPLTVFLLSYAGLVYLVSLGAPTLLLFFVVCVINVLQVKRPHWLPNVLRTWDFLPHWLHSLQPYDVLLQSMMSFVRRWTEACFKSAKKVVTEEDGNEKALRVRGLLGNTQL